ncbi:MAG: S8 family serine peptidase [Patescibacteria group bacterium]
MKVKIFISFFIVAGVFSVWFFNADSGNDKAAQGAGLAEYEPGQILVKFKSAKEAVKVFLAPSESVEEAVRQYKKNPEVESAEPNYTYRAVIIPSDPFYGEQWYLKKIKAQEAWDRKRESPNVTIAIIDSGVQITHPDLAENIYANPDEIAGNKIDDDHNGYIDDVNGWDFVNNVSDPSPKFKPGFTEGGVNHGTIVAGIAASAGNNATGIAGVTWRAKIMPLKVLDDAGQGNTLSVIKAIDYAISKGANILNFSFVGFGYSEALNEAIKRAHDAGVLVVAAAGNESEDGQGFFLDQTPMYPVCHDGPNGENWVIGVAAVDSIDQKSKFSSFGFKCIDLSAPGESVFSTVVYNPSASIGEKFFNSYYEGYWSGTSVAAPQVSGALALLLEVNYGLSRKDAVNLLLDNTDNISRVNPAFLGQLGRGRLNVLNPLDLALAQLNSFSGDIVTAPLAGLPANLKISNRDGEKISEFPVFNQSFRGGVSLASGDIDGDGKDEIIAGAGAGGGPHVQIFSADGKLKRQFFAYAPGFRGGVNVAAGDIDGDGIKEIITGPGKGGGPHVRIFDGSGKVRLQFFSYDKKFTGGVNVAAGDIDGDNATEIITGPGAGGGPHVRIFDRAGRLKGQFFAYDQKFRGGVRIAVGNAYNLSRKGYPQIITAPGPGMPSQIKIFDNTKMLSFFFAYTQSFRGGVSLASGDINNDGLSEIITGAGPGGAPHVRSFTSGGVLLGSYYALAADFNQGVNVGYIKIAK